MKAIVNTAAGQLKLTDVATPQPDPGQVRIRTACCGICATDLEMVDGDSRGKFPQILGHEWSGVVDQCGPGVDMSLLGTHCVAENVLSDGTEVGFERPGGYGEFLITEAEKVIPLPTGFDLRRAALIEPLAVAVRGIKRLQPANGPTLILGDGPLGLMLLMLLKRAGISDITLIGGRPNRLQLAQEFGATKTLNYHDADEDLAGYAADQTTKPVSSIIEAAGSSSVFQLASKLGKVGAKLLLIGNYPGMTHAIQLQELLHREFQIIGSNASAEAWHEAVEIAQDVSLPLNKLITGVYPPDEFDRAIADTRHSRTSLKNLIDWGG